MLSAEDLVNYLPQDLVLQLQNDDHIIIANSVNAKVMLFTRHNCAITFFVNTSTIGGVIDCIRRYKLYDFTYNVVVQESCSELEYIRPYCLVIPIGVNISTPIKCVKYYNHAFPASNNVDNLQERLTCYAAASTKAGLLNYNYGDCVQVVLSFTNGTFPRKSFIKKLSKQFKDKCFVSGYNVRLNGRQITTEELDAIRLNYCKQNFSVNALISERQAPKSANRTS